MTPAELETILILAKLKVEARLEVERRARESIPPGCATGNAVPPPRRNPGKGTPPS